MTQNHPYSQQFLLAKTPSRQYRDIRDGRKTACYRGYHGIFGIIRDQSWIMISSAGEKELFSGGGGT
jgi:hypothetical protein